MVKPSGIGIGIAFAVALLVRRRNILRCAALLGSFAVGAAIPIGATLLYVVRSGITSYLPNVLRQIERYANGTPLGSTWPLQLGIVFVFLGFPLGIRAFLSRKTPRQTTAHPSVVCFVIVWFAIDLIGVMLQRRMYLYHFSR